MPYEITAKSSDKYLKAEAAINLLPNEVISKVLCAKINEFAVDIFIDVTWNNSKATIVLPENPESILITDEYTTARYGRVSLIYKHVNVKEIKFIKSKVNEIVL